MSFSLDKNIVYVNGLVDLEATLKSCADAIVAHNDCRRGDQEAVATAVHAVFDANKGAFINFKALQSFAVERLEVKSLEAWNVLTARVVEYVNENPEIFEVRKGRGVCRIADLSEKDQKKS
jgi:hypothetical protein